MREQDLPEAADSPAPATAMICFEEARTDAKAAISEEGSSKESSDIR